MFKHYFHLQRQEGTKRLTTEGAAISRARRTTEEVEWASDKPSLGTPAVLLWMMITPVGTTSGEVNKGITTTRYKHPMVEMNRTRGDAHGILMDTDNLMDVPGPTSSAILMKSKAMALEGATERTVLMADAREKEAAVQTTRKDSGMARISYTAPANTRARERVDRDMEIIPGPTTTPRGVRSMTIVRAPRGAVTATASARGAIEDTNTVGTTIALVTDMEVVRRTRATDAGLGVMGATRIPLAPRG